MKVTSTLITVTVCAGVASAFGLQSSPKSIIKNVRNNAAFIDSGKAMVQPMDINGKRVSSPFVSIKLNRKQSFPKHAIRYLLTIFNVVFDRHSALKQVLQHQMH